MRLPVLHRSQTYCASLLVLRYGVHVSMYRDKKGCVRAMPISFGNTQLTQRNSCTLDRSS